MEAHIDDARFQPSTGLTRDGSPTGTGGARSITSSAGDAIRRRGAARMFRILPAQAYHRCAIFYYLGIVSVYLSSA
jgi:hypothetical protein